MLDEQAAAEAGWHKCAGGEWTKIVRMPEGERQIAVSSAKNALHYEKILAGHGWLPSVDRETSGAERDFVMPGRRPSTGTGEQQMKQKWIAIVTRNLNTGSDHASIYPANLLLSAEEAQALDVTDWTVHVPPATNNVYRYRGAFSSREAAIRCVKRDFPGIRVAATVREG